MSWEEYGIRILAYSQQQEDVEAELYLTAWLHQREVAAVRKDKYVYPRFSDFYNRENHKNNAEKFERLRKIAERVRDKGLREEVNNGELFS